MPFRPHKGMLVEKVILVYPDFIAWLYEKKRLSKFDYLYDHIDKCIEIFDSKPFALVRCRGKIEQEPCIRPVTRMTLYPGSPRPHFWCDKCDIWKFTDAYEFLDEARTYREALHFIKYSCKGIRLLSRYLIKQIYQAKGLTGMLTKKRILSFFHNQ